MRRSVPSQYIHNVPLNGWKAQKDQPDACRRGKVSCCGSVPLSHSSNADLDTRAMGSWLPSFPASLEWASTQPPDKRGPLGAASQFEAQDPGQGQQAGRGSAEAAAKIHVGATRNYLKVSEFQIIRIIML